MTKYNINLNVVLRAIDSKNFELYQAFRHQEVERKELDRMLGYILPIWVSGIASSSEQIDMTFAFNQYINIGWRELDKHPEMRAKLLALIGPGHTVRHDFHLREATANQTNLGKLLLLRYPDIRKDEINLWCSVNNEAALLDMCNQYGIQAKERDAILVEYRRAVS
jgi:hypothetical protein